MRLKNTTAAETHLVIQGARMNTIQCQRGDLVVLGSDGIFDNLSDEDVVRILETECASRTMEDPDGRPSGAAKVDRAPTVAQLRRAADALVAAAISSVRVDRLKEGVDEFAGEVPWQSTAGGNADDTTAIVAAVVEADDVWPTIAREASSGVVSQARPSFRVGRRRGSNAAKAAAAAAASATETGILGFWAGLGGIIPQCCKTSVDWEDHEESVSNNGTEGELIRCSPLCKDTEAEFSFDQDAGEHEACVVS